MLIANNTHILMCNSIYATLAKESKLAGFTRGKEQSDGTLRFDKGSGCSRQSQSAKVIEAIDQGNSRARRCQAKQSSEAGTISA